MTDFGLASCLIEFNDGIARAALVGDLDFASSDRIGEQLLNVDVDVIVVDLSAVTFFDVSSLRILQRLNRRFGDRFSIASPSAAVQRVLEVTETAFRFHEVS